MCLFNPTGIDEDNIELCDDEIGLCDYRIAPQKRPPDRNSVPVEMPFQS